MEWGVNNLILDTLHAEVVKGHLKRYYSARVSYNTCA